METALNNGTPKEADVYRRKRIVNLPVKELVGEVAGTYLGGGTALALLHGRGKSAAITL